MTDPLPADIPTAVARLAGFASLKTVLRVLVRSTGMRIALVARVTPDAWTCCAVLDDAGFGLAEGSSLDVSTTY